MNHQTRCGTWLYLGSPGDTVSGFAWRHADGRITDARVCINLDPDQPLTTDQVREHTADAIRQCDELDRLTGRTMEA